MDFLEIIKLEQQWQKEKLRQHRAMLESLGEDSAALNYGLRRDGQECYYIIDAGRRTYANQSMLPRVNRLKLREYLKKEIRYLEENQELFAKLIKLYKKTDYDAVNLQLPRAYRGAHVPATETVWRNRMPPFTPSENPYYPEELIHTTSFNLKVRTKGEMIIAELLYKLGIPFCYERGLALHQEDGNLKIVYPDFSIWIEGEWFYIEHLGRLDLESYRQRNAAKLHEYHSNGILMPGQLLFTMDGPDGEFDAGPLMDFLQVMILPRLYRAERVC